MPDRCTRIIQRADDEKPARQAAEVNAVAGVEIILNAGEIENPWTVVIKHTLPRCGGYDGSIGHSLGDMGSQAAAVARQVEILRRDGTVAGKFSSSEEAAAWRAVMRRACRAAGLRIRTGLANADERIAWVYHVDHVLTEAEDRAARRAIDAAYNDEPRLPFHQMVREEQRKMLQVVRDDETRTI